MAEKDNVETQAVEQALTGESTPGPTIGLQDLQNAVKVIDYAAEQGAFKGWAIIEQVLVVRNKINSFVAAAMPKEEPKKEEAPAAKKTAPKKTATPAGKKSAKAK